LGAIAAIAIHLVFHQSLEVVTGLLSGATTNTPSLAAAQQMLTSLHAPAERIATTGLGYAVAYPFGIVGILLTMGLLRTLFKVNVGAEVDSFTATRDGKRLPIEKMSIEIRNPSVTDIPISRLPALHGAAVGVIVSRIWHDGRQHVALPADVLKIDDVVLCTGPRPQLESVRDLLGVESDLKLHEIVSPLRARSMLVSNRKVYGKRIAELHIRELYEVTITRLNRAGVELSASANLKLQFGDYLTCVGEEDHLKQVEEIIGNQKSTLEQTQIIPIFIGIALGVLLGSVPVYLPRMPAPVSLGLAGGPVIVAIVLSRIGTIGPLRWNMPPDTINTLRELGVTLFMACVGIYAGKSFAATVLNGDGLRWMACASLITFFPLFVVGILARGILKINYLTLCGMLAGSMTDPPALAFANDISPSQAQSTAYAAVYPLTMCLRIMAPQIILGMFWLVA
jgi:putative transport protein